MGIEPTWGALQSCCRNHATLGIVRRFVHNLCTLLGITGDAYAAVCDRAVRFASQEGGDHGFHGFVEEGAWSIEHTTSSSTGTASTTGTADSGSS